MPWFVKTETFLRPYGEMRPHLAAHRAWVEEQRAAGVRMARGCRVDVDDRPGGGRLLLLEAEDHATAEALVRQDPMVRSGGVDWRLHRWVPSVGDRGVAGLPGPG
ncbi:MAG: YciI family protein [Cyanobacteriota bacterium]